MDSGYLLYFLIAVGLSALVTAAFRRFREDDRQAAPLEDGGAFDRRMAKLEERFGQTDQGRNEIASGNLDTPDQKPRR